MPSKSHRSFPSLVSKRQNLAAFQWLLVNLIHDVNLSEIPSKLFALLALPTHFKCFEGFDFPQIGLATNLIDKGKKGASLVSLELKMKIGPIALMSGFRNFKLNLQMEYEKHENTRKL